MTAELTCREACAEAILHDEHSVLGLKLKPFCLEMWLMLAELGSPLLLTGGIRIADLQLAVLVCSTDSIGDFYRRTRTPGLRQKLWLIVSRGYHLRAEMDKFNRYIDDYCPNFPRWQFDEMEGEPTKCPDVMICAAKLIDRGHDPHKIKRQMGLGEVLAWGLAIDESNGKNLDTIISEHEQEALRQLEERARARR